MLFHCFVFGRASAVRLRSSGAARHLCNNSARPYPPLRVRALYLWWKTTDVYDCSRFMMSFLCAGKYASQKSSDSVVHFYTYSLTFCSKSMSSRKGEGVGWAPMYKWHFHYKKTSEMLLLLNTKYNQTHRCCIWCSSESETDLFLILWCMFNV